MRLLTILLFMSLAACGQAGDLYLPDPKPTASEGGAKTVPPYIPEPEGRKPGRPQGQQG